jgi:hypothetical protein
MRKKIQPFRERNKLLTDFVFSVTVVRTKEKQLQRNLMLLVNTDDKRKLKDGNCYDNFVNYLQFSYDKYVTPLYTNICKIGDVVSVEGAVDEELFFDEDKCTISVVVSIPNNYKENWQIYIADRYKELVKFNQFFEQFIFHVREYQVQKVEFRYNFTMEQNQTIKYLVEHNEIEQEVIGFWISAFNEVEEKVRSEGFHTNEIPVKVVDTEYGPRLEFCSETIKIKI